MASENATPPLWDFTHIYDVLDALKGQDQAGDEPRRPSSPLPRYPSPSGFDPKVKVPRNLGDFNRLFEFLGLPTEDFEAASRPRHDTIDSDISLSDQSNVSSDPKQLSTPPSSLTDDAIQFDEFVDRKGVRWTDEVERSTFFEGKSGRSSKIAPRLSHIKNSADFDSDSEDETFQHIPLIPSWVTPQPKLWLPPIPRNLDPTIFEPLDTLTEEEKRTKLLRKLNKKFGAQALDKAQKLHIFVDCSNIIIGFCDTLKTKRGQSPKQFMKQPPFSWNTLGAILERGRPTAKRIVVGSHGSSRHLQTNKPLYIQHAEELGYECNMLVKVEKPKDPAPTKRKKRGNGNGYATSGHSSSDGGLLQMAVTEQGVDEILHMKMLESLVDAQEPATIVLATGDAAEAEYSGGFLKNVERALEKGWKIEIVAWSAGLSRDYTILAQTPKWKDKVTIIELDDFSEELLAIYTDKRPVRFF